MSTSEAFLGVSPKTVIVVMYPSQVLLGTYIFQNSYTIPKHEGLQRTDRIITTSCLPLESVRHNHI